MTVMQAARTNILSPCTATLKTDCCVIIRPIVLQLSPRGILAGIVFPVNTTRSYSASYDKTHFQLYLSFCSNSCAIKPEAQLLNSLKFEEKSREAGECNTQLPRTRHIKCKVGFVSWYMFLVIFDIFAG